MYDVIFVGAGVAGCYTASLLPSKLNILLLEKDKKVRPKDSGLVSRKFDEFIQEPKLIKGRKKEIECVSPSGKTFSLGGDEPYLYLLKREKFSEYLREKARKRGELRFERVTDVISRKDRITVRTTSTEYDTRMVIGCDGANSLVRKKLGIQAPALSVGMMVKAENKMTGKIRVFFNKYYSPDYFSWIIPNNREYGLITAVRPKDYLAYFREKMKLSGGCIHASLIPMGTTKSYGHRTLLIGDACGQNKPLTGGGIVFSLMASRHAAQIIRDAFEMNTFNAPFLNNYERLWKAELQKEINRQKVARKIYRKLSNKEIDKLFDDFGQHIQSLKSFDYDKFSLSLGILPKGKLMKFALLKAWYAL